MQKMPNDLTTEAAFLSSILANPIAIVKCQDIQPEMFYHAKNKKIFMIMMELFKKDIPVDLIEINKRIEDDELKDYLIEISDIVYTDANIEMYQKQVIDYYRRRKNILLLDETMKNLYQNENYDEVMENLINSYVTEINSENEIISFDEAMQETIDKIENRDNSNIIKTGLYDIDDVLKIKPGKLILIGGRPSHGKSILAKEIAINNIKDDKSVLFVTLEMDFAEQVERIFSTESNVDYENIQNKKGLSSEDTERIIETCEKLEGKNLYFTKNFNMSVAKIKAQALKLKASKAGLDLIIVDYLQLIQPEDKKIIREQQVAEISRSLKLLCNSLNVAIVLLTQLNRKCEERHGADKMPQLADLRESGAIEQDADAVIFTMCPAKYGIEKINDISIDENVILLRIAKNRQGRTKNYMQFYFNGKQVTIKDVVKF